MFEGLFGLSGRIGRGGWWFGQLIGLLIIVFWIASIFMFGDPSAAPEDNFSGMSLIFLLISVLLIATINICSTVKRYHDRGKSGWWLFVSFVPFIGGIWQFIECGFCSGDDGDNKYGPPPGSVERSDSFGREVSTTRSAGLAKLDDDYIANYAKNIAANQTQQQLAPAPSFGQAGAGRPVFGKR